MGPAARASGGKQAEGNVIESVLQPRENKKERQQRARNYDKQKDETDRADCAVACTGVLPFSSFLLELDFQQLIKLVKIVQFWLA